MTDTSSRPRIGIVTSNFWPERTGIGQVITEFAQFFGDEGVDVHVATAMPYYPEWQIYPKYRGKLLASERLGNITIHRAWHFSSPSPSAVERIVHELSLCLFSIPGIVRSLRGARVAYIVSPDLSLALVASIVARMMGVRRIAMVQDVMPDAAVELGMLRNRAVIAVSRWMARRIYALADEIYTLGEGMRRRIAQQTDDPTKIRIVPNTIDTEELAAGPNQGRPFRQRFVAEGTFAVVHTGNMGQKQDLELLLRTARLLRGTPDIHFFVFGDGAVRESFLKTKTEWELTNVSHFPFQDREMLPHMLYGADVLLVSQLPEVVDIVVPSKLVTAMGAGAMIVAACAIDSEAAQMIQQSRGGIIVAASDADALAGAILSIKDGQIDTAALRHNARAHAVRVFDRDAAYGELTAAHGLGISR